MLASLFHLDFIVTELPLHQINLHGPWKLNDVNSDAETSPRFKYPLQLSEITQSGKVTLSRKFHHPSGLGDDQKVYLEFKLNFEVERCLINGGELEMDSSNDIRMDVTDHLQAFNEVELILSLPKTFESGIQIFESSKLMIIKPGENCID